MAYTFKLLVIVLLLCLLTKLEFSSSTINTKILCSIKEKQALLAIHKGLGERPPFWIGENCCTWEGVGCDKWTGSVITLNLTERVGTLDPSLLELKQLQFLDLSRFETNKTSIPDFIGSLRNLKYLDLSYARFSGKLPPQLGNLSNLRYLDLNGMQDIENLECLGNLSKLNHLSITDGTIKSPLFSDFEWLSHLLHLEYLDTRFMNFGKPSNLLQVTSMLPSLLELYLSGLEYFPSLPYVNFTSLEILDLSRSSFNSSLPYWLYTLHNLTDLHLRFCRHSGALSTAISNLKSLTFLDLSESDFEGEIPQTLGDLCNLEYIGLSFNEFRGDITKILSDLSNCVPATLVSIDLRYNQLSGSLPPHLGNLKNLNYLDLSSNNLGGLIPESLGGLSNLETLDIGSNSFEGVVTETHFANLRNLIYLYASNNSLILNVSSIWIPSFQLKYLSLASWKLGPRFPAWLKTQHSLSDLYLSSSGISEEMPTWFWNMTSHISSFDLSNNKIKGEIPQISQNEIKWVNSKISHTGLNLSNNSFSGNLSSFLCNSTVEITNMLDLSNNLLSGDLSECWEKWNNLRYLSLSHNDFSGNIPSSMGFLSNLESFHVLNNSLSGKIPSTMQNWSQIQILDLSQNNLFGSIPPWIGTRLSDLKFLSLRSNEFIGEIPRELCDLASLRTLDLANNYLSSTMPRCFGNFTGMLSPNWTPFSLFREKLLLMTKGQEREYNNKVLELVMSMDLSSNNLSGIIPEELTHLLGLRSLNLSHNHITGRIPFMIGKMRMLESLDLSTNQLEGEIPLSLSNISMLSGLNVSYNHLLGKIPTGSQLQGFEESSFIGNDGLCGPPLQICSKNPDKQHDQDDDNDDMLETFYLGAAFAPGYAVGFVGFFAVLVFVDSWRLAFFGFVNNMNARLFASFQ